MIFHTDSLLSKWGFSDGDMLEDLLYDNNLGDVDTHTVLIKVVKEMVAPKVKQVLDIYEIPSIHNPIRTNSVDGVAVDHY